jgi:dTDP-4-dehydrorhamnose reductase
VIRAPGRTALDVRELDHLRAALREHRPSLIINAAAQSNVDLGEEQTDLTYAVNAVGAHNAALAAAEADVPLMHISTDYVFDGTRREPYREFHPTGVPLNHYGRSKLQGELLVRATLPRHFIVRVAALFSATGRADFVDWVLQEARPSAPLRIVADRFTSPTWTVDLSRQLLQLARTPYYGTYHASGHGVASWYELARSALIITGADPAGVTPVPDCELESRAVRPAYTPLDNHLLRLRGLDSMLAWRQALELRLGSSGG